MTITRVERDCQRRLWRRRSWLDCGHTECRCDFREHPTEQQTNAYAAAVEHLADEGCLAAAFTPELRALWRRGGAERALAEAVNRRWSA